VAPGRENSVAPSPNVDATDPATLLEDLGGAERIHGAVLFDGRRALVAVRGDERFAAAAASLLEVADSARGEPISHAHVATDTGEVFAVRGSELALVVSAPRFQLASLMLLDMRALVRQLEGTTPPRADLLSEKEPVVSGGAR